MNTERIELHRLCGLSDRPMNGTSWHDAIIAGLPAKAVRRTAEAIGVQDTELADLLGIHTDMLDDKTSSLPRDVSNFLYRIALALTRAIAKNGGDADKAAHWLRNAEPTIKNYIPILLLQSHIGAEYVFACIERMESPKDKLVHQDEAPDVGTTEFAHRFEGEDEPAEEDGEGNPFALVTDDN